MWKNTKDIEKYCELLKNQDPTVDCTKIEKYIAEKYVDDQIKEKVHDALPIVNSYGQYSIYYSKNNISITVVNNKKIYSCSIPITTFDEIKINHVKDKKEFVKFIHLMVRFVDDEKVYFLTGEEFDIYIKYRNLLTWEMENLLRDSKYILDFFFDNIELNENNLQKYMSIFHKSRFGKLYSMREKEQKLEFIIKCNLNAKEKVQILSCIKVNKKYRKDVNRVLDEYIKSNPENKIMDDRFVHSLMQQI